MPALVTVLALALAGAVADPPPLSPTADNDAIYEAIVAADPTLTKSPTSLDSLVAATELAEQKLRQADDPDDTEDLLTLVAQGRRTAHGRTGDAQHLCRLVAAADHVLTQGTAGPRLSAAASDFRAEAERDAGAEGCGDAPPASPTPESTPQNTAGSAADTVTPQPEPTPPPPPPRPVDQHDRRRLRAGVGVLVPGLLLFAPMAGLLAVRADARRDLADLNADTATRPATDAEMGQAAALYDRHTATTAAAAVLGATGGVLVVTAAVLLATKRRQPRAALAPWGGRGVGGIVLQGRF